MGKGITMQLSRAKLGLALGGFGLLLAACDGDSGSNRSGIDSLGSEFVNAFRADANAVPVDAEDVSMTLSPTIEPFDPT